MTFSERVRPAAAFEDALIERLTETPGLLHSPWLGFGRWNADHPMH